LVPGKWAQAANVFGFVDYGEAYDRSIARDGQQNEALGSIGLGAQIEINDWLSLTPQVVRQIEGTPRDSADNRRETRLFIGAVGRF
jgi:hemolysin activation/secretion protein